MNGTSLKRIRDAKPPRIEPVIDNVPEVVRELPRWVGWRWEWKGGKWDKPPIQVRNGRNASSTNPRTWGSHAEAFAAYVNRGDLDGIGVTLGPVRDGLHLVGVDFDDCRDRETGEVDADVLAMIESLDCYTEVSPSGEGVKCLTLGRLPEGERKRKFKLRGDASVEFYETGRYFTVTGKTIPQSKCVLEDRSEQLAALYGEAAGRDGTPCGGAGGAEKNGKPPAQTAPVHAASVRYMHTKTKNIEDGADGSKRLFTTACCAIELALSEAAAVAAIRVYERERPFPKTYSDAEVAQRYRDAAARPDVEWGSAAACAAPDYFYLVILEAEPKVFLLFSPTFHEAPDSCIELSPKQFLSWQCVRHAAAEQANAWLPGNKDDRRQWEKDGGHCQRLMRDAKRAEAPPERRQTAVVAGRMLDLMGRARPADPDDQPDKRGKPTRLSDGSLVFRFSCVLDEFSFLPRDDRPTRNELSKLLQSVGVQEHRLQEGGKRTRLHILDADALRRLEEVAEGPARQTHDLSTGNENGFSPQTRGFAGSGH